MPPRRRSTEDTSGITDIIMDTAPQSADTANNLFGPANDTEPEEKAKPFTEQPPLETIVPKRRNTKLRTELLAFYGFAGVSLSMVDQQLGSVVLSQAEDCANSLADLADKNPKVKAALEKMMETSAYTGVIVAHLPIAVAVATKYVPSLRTSYEGMFGATDG